MELFFFLFFLTDLILRAADGYGPSITGGASFFFHFCLIIRLFSAGNDFVLTVIILLDGFLFDV
jgi:hypothetical protein